MTARGHSTGGRPVAIPVGQCLHFMLVLCGVSLLASCTNAQRVVPVDLTEPNRELTRTTDNLENYVFQLEASIEKLTEFSSALLTLDRRRLEAPFPTDAFKHALISCLNTTSMQLEAGQPDLVQIAKRYGITCPVQAIRALDKSLDPETDGADFAISAMQKLDGFRVQRNIVQNLLRKLPDQLSRTNSFIGTRKSELRKTRDQIRRRRAEFRPPDFADAMRRLDAYEERLNTLEERTVEVADLRPGWMDELGVQIDALYKMIAELDNELPIEGSSEASVTP